MCKNIHFCKKNNLWKVHFDPCDLFIYEWKVNVQRSFLDSACFAFALLFFTNLKMSFWTKKMIFLIGLFQFWSSKTKDLSVKKKQKMAIKKRIAVIIVTFGWQWVFVGLLTQITMGKETFLTVRQHFFPANYGRNGPQSQLLYR